MMEFHVKLIKVNPPHTKESMHSVNVNCTHVMNEYYIYEGDEFALEEDGVKFQILGEGIVGALGGLSKNKLIKICEDAFGINPEDVEASK